MDVRLTQIIRGEATVVVDGERVGVTCRNENGWWEVGDLVPDRDGFVVEWRGYTLPRRRDAVAEIAERHRG